MLTWDSIKRDWLDEEGSGLLSASFQPCAKLWCALQMHRQRATGTSMYLEGLCYWGSECQFWEKPPLTPLNIYPCIPKGTTKLPLARTLRSNCDQGLVSHNNLDSTFQNFIHLAGYQYWVILVFIRALFHFRVRLSAAKLMYDSRQNNLIAWYFSPTFSFIGLDYKSTNRWLLKA